MPTDTERLELLLDLRRFADAERAARDMIARAPDAAGGYVNLARALHAQNKPEAIEAAHEGVRKAPRDAWPQSLLACVLDHFGRHADALAPAEEAVRINPHYAWGWSMLSRVLHKLGRHAESHAKALEGLRLDPLSADLICRRGWADYYLGNRAEAARTAEEGLKHHPNSHVLLNLLGYAKRALAEATWGRARVRLHRDADVYTRAAVRLDPTEAVYRDNLRANALSCRRAVAMPPLRVVLVLCLLTALGITCFVLQHVNMDLAICAGWSCFVSFCAAVYCVDSDRLALALPLSPFRIPTVPITSRERWLGRLQLCGYVAALFLPYGFIVCGLK